MSSFYEGITHEPEFFYEVTISDCNIKILPVIFGSQSPVTGLKAMQQAIEIYQSQIYVMFKITIFAAL